MSLLDKVTLTVESAGFRPNVRSILHEIRHALHRLAEGGESTIIDLWSIPVGRSDEAFLLQTLGEGEVQATVEALGPTRVWETAYPGVWVVDHYNTEEQRVALRVEVTGLPGILCADREDIRESARRMEETLQEARNSPAAPGY